MLDNIWKAHDSSPWQNNFINRIQIHNQNSWFKPMTILSMEFKSIIKAHGLNPWQFIYPKPNLHWQYQSLIFISNIKNPIFIGNIKIQFSLTIFKTQFSLTISKVQLMLALLKVQANYLTLFFQKPKVINTWQNTIS